LNVLLIYGTLDPDPNALSLLLTAASCSSLDNFAILLREYIDNLK
jgi:hypothetical protein